MEAVYVETTVIGHVAGRLHPVACVLARQQTTREWWETTQHLIDAVCRNAGIECPVICTPEQLLVTYDDS